MERLSASDSVYEKGDKVRMGFWRDVKPERWIDAAKVVWYGVRGMLWRRLMQGARDGSGALLVNAALTYRSTSRIGNGAQIVDL